MPLDIVHSVCPHDCPSTCALEVERIDSRTIGRVRGARDNDYTAGVICAKTARYAERVHHPDRLKEPLLRIGPKGIRSLDNFRPISWEEALDRTAEAFEETARRWGREAIWPYYYAGTMGQVQRDGINRLRHVMRYSGQYNTICTSLPDAGWRAGHGSKWGADPREIADSELIVVWGGNPVATQVNVMTHISRARKANDAKLVVVDPYRSGTAEVADIHLMPRPGTDGALACAVMHVLFKEGFADTAYLDSLTDWRESGIEAHLASRTPKWAAGITGLSVEEIVGFARLWGGTRKAFLRCGYGFARSRNGAQQMHAATCLPVITGAWRHKGGGALYGNADIYHLDKTLIEGLDRRDPEVRMLDQTRLGPVLVGDEDALMGGGPVHALLIQNTNPMVVCPEAAKVHAGFARDDIFVTVHEQFLTETAAMADVVLPATTFLEHDDLYTSGGHVYLQIAKKVIEPLADTRPNHYVICELAKRLGADHPGFDMTEREIIDRTLISSGFPDFDTLADAKWHDCMPDFGRAHYLERFGTPDGRFHFRPDWSRIGPDFDKMSPLPDHLETIEAADEEHPFRMMTSPARQFLNSSFTETPGSVGREGEPKAKLHPKDLATLGLADGDRVRLGNRRGSLVVKAESFDGLQPGVVVVEGLWPNEAFEEGIGINLLIGADPGPPAGGGVFHDAAIWVRPA